jgi:hypothetical protein
MTEPAGDQPRAFASEADAVALLPPDPFVLVTIEEPNGNRPRVEAPILRPLPARDALGPGAVIEYGDLPCITLIWAETLEPLYAGHPGSVWPVVEGRRVGREVILTGPRGAATFRRMPTKQLWHLCGWADLARIVEASPSSDAVERDRWLPLNRKERFYTGTVLHMIGAGDRFGSLGRMLKLCGLEQLDLGKSERLQFFTDYSFADSVFTDDDTARFPRRPPVADTPDVVIFGSWLLAIEAKMFHRPNAAALNAQYDRQSELVAYWQGRLGLHKNLVRHCLLLPQPLAADVSEHVHAPIVTWESVAHQFRTVADPYWIGVLHDALDRYRQLAAKDSVWGLNKQMALMGLDIVTAYRERDPRVTWVGRQGGLSGSELTHDAATGAWRTHLRGPGQPTRWKRRALVSGGRLRRASTGRVRCRQ